MALTVALIAPAVCARADLKSGPNVGVKVGKLKVFATTGAHENKELDYAAERKDYAQASAALERLLKVQPQHARALRKRTQVQHQVVEAYQFPCVAEPHAL
jgi:hypothetical protein